MRKGFIDIVLYSIILSVTQYIIDISLISVPGTGTIALFVLYLCIPYINLRGKEASVGNNDFSQQVINSRYDILFAVQLTGTLLCLEALLPLLLSKYLFAALMVMMWLFFLTVPISQIYHYHKFNEGISVASLVSIQQTRLEEAIGFFRSCFANSTLWMIGVSIIFVICGFSIYFCYVYDFFSMGNHTVQLLILTIVMLFILIRLFTKTSLVRMWIEVELYRKNDREFLKQRKSIYDKLSINREKALPNALHGTVILVIGESASRDYMHFYQKNYSYDNTPWLEEKSNDKNFIVFENAVASYNQTMEVLKMALTEASQYNSISFTEAVSIIDIARKCGYDTYWFSHQGRLGQSNVATTMIASTADSFDCPLEGGNVGYDKDLLENLMTVDPKKNNFVVIHIMGSHGYYKTRYPSSWTKFEGDSNEAFYANTIRYTDEFLQECYDYANANLNLQAMVYFSDHGNNPDKGHFPSLREANQVRIPMFVYLSEEYAAKYPEKLRNIQLNKKQFYSNDMLYNTMLGLLNVETPNYDSREDISSDQYAFDESNVMTFLGTVQASSLK